MNPETGEMIAETAEKSLKKAQELPMVSPEGEEWSYNQLGFMLMANVLEELTGNPFEQLLKKHVFEPLNMNATSYADDEPGYETSMSFSTMGSEDAQPFFFDFEVKAAGGIYTTVGDMLKFIRGLKNHELLSRKLKDLMWSKVTLSDGQEVDYGFGWDIHTVENKLTVGHSGGMKAVLTHFPKQDLTIIILTNTYGSNPVDMVAPIAKIYF